MTTRAPASPRAPRPRPPAPLSFLARGAPAPGARTSRARTLAAAMVAAAALAAVGGCCPLFSPTPAEDPARPGSPPSATPPSAAPPAPGEAPAVSGNGGLGGTQVQLGGGPVWPPSGPGCEKLVACCESAQRLEPAIGLGCQLSVAQRPVDCAVALQSVTSMIREMGRPLPDACR